MGVIAEALMMRLRALAHPRLLTNKDILRFRSLFYLGFKCVFQYISSLAKGVGVQLCALPCRAPSLFCVLALGVYVPLF